MLLHSSVISILNNNAQPITPACFYSQNASEEDLYDFIQADARLLVNGPDLQTGSLNLIEVPGSILFAMGPSNLLEGPSTFDTAVGAITAFEVELSVPTLESEVSGVVVNTATVSSKEGTLIAQVSLAHSFGNAQADLSIVINGHGEVFNINCDEFTQRIGLEFDANTSTLKVITAEFGPLTLMENTYVGSAESIVYFTIEQEDITSLDTSKLSYVRLISNNSQMLFKSEYQLTAINLCSQLIHD